MTPNGAVLECEGLCVRRGRREVVREVGLQLRAGELVALLGPNGAGKSTLLDALSGGLAPAAGTIQRHGRVAVALQSGDLARCSVLANVMLALAWWGVPRGEREARARAALAAFGAGQLAGRPALSLSGGERRRVHLARAIAVAPDALQLDEPFTGLDPQTGAHLLSDSVSALRSPTRATLVVVHDRAEAWALADRMLVLIGGELVASGAPRELLAAPQSARVAHFLGYDGWLVDDGELLLTRPAHVTLDPAGALRAHVTRAVPLEDGLRLELEPADRRGRLSTIASLPAPAVGESVRVHVDGGARFPAQRPESAWEQPGEELLEL
ncbi:MAG: ATP-binding cassette domain-containing protein [Solirubrobacteraceae bacterium]